MDGIVLPKSLSDFFEQALTPEFWNRAIGTALAVALILLLFRILQILVIKALRRTMPEPRAVLIRKAIRYTGYVIAAATVLRAAGVDLSALLGAAGIAGIAIGFAAQTSVSNLISGLFLISEKPFQIGDVIQTGDITGTVMSIDLLSIKIQTFDNRFVRIPNETIIKTNVTNITRFPIRRLDITLNVSYRSDLEKVKALLEQIAVRNPFALENPAPLIMIQNFGESGISILFGVWFEQSRLLDLRNSMLVDIHRRFAEEGIEIPYPQMDVHIKNQNEG